MQYLKNASALNSTCAERFPDCEECTSDSICKIIKKMLEWVLSINRSIRMHKNMPKW